MQSSFSKVEAISWTGTQLKLLDQQVLPSQIHYVLCSTAEDVAKAIQQMVVRGAPAIGISAAYGAVLAATEGQSISSLMAMLDMLSAARPTAVNLRWAIERMRKLTNEHVSSSAEEQVTASLKNKLMAEAVAIHQEDVSANQIMGQYGKKAILASSSAGHKLSVMTHCNAGALATGGYGTALGVIRALAETNELDKVWVNETRPWLQGARLTAWELTQENIPFVVGVDGAAAYHMTTNKIDWVIVGADRITANGDTANKIGTYGLALLAHHHGCKFMVVAPSSTVDMSLASGEEIEIECRGRNELIMLGDKMLAPENTSVSNPVFDVTPASLINMIVTERGVIENPTQAKMQQLFC
ncbi:S-methyl-5-thioribose-1-phosphate isomerase [Zooshikella harenae]|uniref:Methylthioribose-1-phosphate isomerase n=1 Tax=Zooshikella harenae TaxID=2827238 RepID=A0ABS5ZBQ6_9GAMM|nr:S-methyl-5-thioribose-1-phosphate isomerase [Zooshikella harenae]MBU2710352.1 S-methyl-5-thioribose-1-phosphate isomerase [Zooshikella harenae]